MISCRSSPRQTC
uniref:Uncharacterized protein n=1 Tax=Anguilla anguilla TaxID=7936 RepID=A0A0E9RSS7_ANGAN